MKKIYLLLLAIGVIAPKFSVNAQVTGMPSGYITTAPTISTAENPVWYNTMSTNTDAARVNRYMYSDGTVLKTDLYNSPGITDALQHDKYLWRLEQGPSGANYVIFVNKLTGKKLFGDVALGNNGVLSVADNGIEWKMAAASAVTTGTVAGQFCFNFESLNNTYGIRYLNAGDGVSMNWNVLVFNGTGSPAKSSGWFFYPVTSTKTVTFAQPTNGTIAITGTNGTATAPAVTSGSQVLVGTVATINLTPANGYQLSTLTVNGTDVTASVVGSAYKLTVNTDATIAATFTTGTTTAVSTPKKSNALYISGNTLNIDSRLNNSAVTIYDVCGKQALTSTESSINISSLKKGAYVVKYTTTEGIKTSKITK